MAIWNRADYLHFIQYEPSTDIVIILPVALNSSASRLLFNAAFKFGFTKMCTCSPCEASWRPVANPNSLYRSLHISSQMIAIFGHWCWFFRDSRRAPPNICRQSSTVLLDIMSHWRTQSRPNTSACNWMRDRVVDEIVGIMIPSSVTYSCAQRSCTLICR